MSVPEFKAKLHIILTYMIPDGICSGWLINYRGRKLLLFVRHVTQNDQLRTFKQIYSLKMAQKAKGFEELLMDN
jgi:hypothetical protein